MMKKGRTTFTKTDEIMEYVKMGCMVLLALGYCYLIFKQEIVMKKYETQIKLVILSLIMFTLGYIIGNV